jgi:transposase
MKKSTKVTAKPLASLTKKELETVDTIGIDLGDRKSTYAVVDHDGRIIAEGTVSTREVELRRLLGGGLKTRIVIETGTHSTWVSRTLTGLGHDVIVGNARELAAIYKNKKKSDKVDPRTLAKLGRADRSLLHPIQHRPEQVQRSLSVVRSRDVAVKTRRTLINSVRGTVKTFGKRLPGCDANAFGKTAPFVPEELKSILEPLYEAIAILRKQILVFDKRVDELIETEYPHAKLLMAIRGVGPITALTFVLLLADARRFSSSRAVGAYFGLVPAQSDSGQSTPQMRITKQGDGLMRRLLVNSAHYILGPFGEDCDLRRHGLKLAERGGKNAKKRAVVAIARRLCVLMHHLWATESVYEPLYQAKRTKTAAVAA